MDGGRRGSICALAAFVSLAVHLAAFGGPYSVEVSATPPKMANPGEIVTHVFTIENLGTEDDFYLLELEIPQGWDFFPEMEAVFVRAGEAEYVFVNLIVPPSAPAGTYSVVLRATSSGDPKISAEAGTKVEVLPRRDFELSWRDPPERLQVGREAVWTFLLENTGNVPDTYLVKLERFGEWEAEVSAPEVHLLPGEEEAVEVLARVPSRARAGSSYTLRIIVTSAHDPTCVKELRASGRFLPPPPELVPRSLYPRWDVTLGAALDSEGNPRFSFRGTGDIEVFDYRVDAGMEASLDGLGELRLRWEGHGKSFFLHGGGIAGLLLGVSGKPLFGGEIEGLGRWRALFTPSTKGLSVTGEGEGVTFNFVWGGDLHAGHSFRDIGFRWSPEDRFSFWGTISQGEDLSSTGTAVQMGGELSLPGSRLRCTCLCISPGYPRQGLRDELSFRWESLRASLPLELRYRFVSVARETPAERLVSHELRVPFSLDAPLRPRLELGYIRRYAEPPPRDVDEQVLSARLSLHGEAPISWNSSLDSSFTEDFVAGTTVGRLSLSGGFTIRAEVVELSFRAGVTGALGIGAEPPTSSFTLRARFPGVLGSPDLVFRAGGERAELSCSFRDVPTGEEGEASGRLTYTLEEGASRWEASLSLSFPADFPFLGPTRGRIRGRIFLDRDGDHAFGPGDEGVEGVLLEANGAEALSGDEGIFAFPPLLPGRYRITFVEPPPEFVPLLPLPEVRVERGKEVVVEIPLRPRAWLKVHVFHDADKDGLHDPGEAGIPGVEAVVSGEGGTWRLRTDAAGLVSLELPPGRYTVRLIEESLPERYVLTTPGEVEVEVPEYGTAEAAFGAYRKPKPVVVTFGPPIAAISYSPQSPRVGEPVRFSGAGSKAFNAEIVEYRWEFRLGPRALGATGAEVTVSFPEPGRWTVTLIVTDSNGLIGAKRVIVEVSP
ncbi:hypothetical protein DRJ27_02270 [Candidatus Acetothermia bacterium]|nr:MAG: hypothetical protein DRJ27_02270 [Candidatus Acetothermia bacterium]